MEWGRKKGKGRSGQCIQFKIALQTFKTLTTHQPSYIHDPLHAGVLYTWPNCAQCVPGIDMTSDLHEL